LILGNGTVLRTKGLSRLWITIREVHYPNYCSNCWLKRSLGQGSLLAYLVSITLRVVEIHRVLKPTGSFYLHCDSTASHYLKLILDSIFCSLGGDFRNEIVWAYDTAGRALKLQQKHDTIFWYSKSKKEWTFNGKVQGVGVAREATNHMKLGKDEDGRIFYEKKTSLPVMFIDGI
jgi:site-specific DNA-methyltransferase (adenine-specific)